ncbi:MAG: bis-aminopropyl spermidine synthase family protein [Myxococcota bacterium]
MSTSRLRELDELDFHKSQTPGDDDTVFHLADGIVLSIGPRQSRLLDLVADDDIQVDFRYIEPLERLGRGTHLKGYESAVPLLLRTGVIAQGPAKPDQVIRERLQRLDAIYLDHYRERLSDRALQAYHMSLDAHARRKRFFMQVGQCPVLPETALRRALSVGDAQEVGKKRVLCLGDDDLVSLPLAALGHDVTVYDIDDYLLEFLQLAADDTEYSLGIQEVDLRDPLRKTRREYFDVILTDPMSNRDCFELFLSRAFSMLKPGGTIFSACFPPTTALLRTIAEEMGFEIAGWHRRHNRYYNHHLKLHIYESDWVEIRKTETTQETVAADDFCVPLNLYREDFYQRLPVFSAEIDDIEDERFSRPMYIDLIFDALEQLIGKGLRERSYVPGSDWSMASAFSDECRVTIHADRKQRTLVVDMYPFVPKTEMPLRALLMSAFKTGPADARVRTDNLNWSVWIR